MIIVYLPLSFYANLNFSKPLWKVQFDLEQHAFIQMILNRNEWFIKYQISLINSPEFKSTCYNNFKYSYLKVYKVQLMTYPEAKQKNTHLLYKTLISWIYYHVFMVRSCFQNVQPLIYKSAVDCFHFLPFLFQVFIIIFFLQILMMVEKKHIIN